MRFLMLGAQGVMDGEKAQRASLKAKRASFPSPALAGEGGSSTRSVFETGEG